MPRGQTISTMNNLTTGLITELTAMNFPETAISEGDNCVYSELGKVSRRRGMNYESGSLVASLSALTGGTSPNAFVEFRWFSADSLGVTNFVVQQIGSKIYFFLISSNTALSASRKNTDVDLIGFKTSGTLNADVASHPCQFASGKGYLFVTHPLCDPFAVKYDATSDTFTTTKIDIQIRDFEGVVDGISQIDTRPSTLSSQHHYNLLNQGWYITAPCSTSQSSNDPPAANVLQYWASNLGNWPSNADIWWTYKNASEVFVPLNVNKFAVGNTPAPKGHYIYSAVNVNRSSTTGISGLVTDSAGPARPSCIAFYAGRAFYAGISADGYSDKVYFTQIIQSDEQFGKCYQQNDPTSESTFDLLDDDGGVILLPQIEKIVTLAVIGDSLVVIGTNGVFVISGTAQVPFKATGYQISYVSSIGGISNLSVVQIDKTLFWTNNDAMYMIGQDQLGNFAVQNTSKSTIQSVIDNIPLENRPYIKGSYNKIKRIIQWLYSDVPGTADYNYNRILEYNAISHAFYTHTIDSSLAPFVTGIVSVYGQSSKTLSDTLTKVDGTTLITDSSLVNVTVEDTEFTPSTEVFKYPTSGLIFSGAAGFTYSEMNDDNLHDWFAYNSAGTTFYSYGVSGYRIRGDMLRKFNSDPIEFVVGNITNGSLKISALWDYGARQSSLQELYRFVPDLDYQLRRMRVRGKGYSAQIKFESTGNQDFELIGWSSFDTGASIP